MRVLKGAFTNISTQYGTLITDYLFYCRCHYRNFNIALVSGVQVEIMMVIVYCDEMRVTAGCFGCLYFHSQLLQDTLRCFIHVDVFGYYAFTAF